MNHIYRLVFEAATGQWKAVAECARGRGKAGQVRDGRVLAALIFAAGSALAAPQGGNVSAGSGSISVNGATTTVTQTTPKLSLNWTSFNVGSGETVNFQQPSSSAVALNRVLGSEGSQVLGRINANGQVFLLNPNGLLFGRDAQVNVGGLVASTLKLSDADFLAGRYSFTGNAGSIINQGNLNAAPDGYIALLAPEVRNEGAIRTPQGTTLLAAGDKVTLSLDNGSLLGYQIDAGSFNALVENKALVQADGGRVYLAAKAAATQLAKAVVNHEGVIEARTLQDKGGVIELMGDMQKGEVKVTGTLDASAPTTGNGGFVETSAAQVRVADNARITTRAAHGRNGTWLLDPNDFTIAAAGGDITGAVLSAQLGGGNVVIQSASGGPSGNGDIFVNDGVTWSANTLTLNAQRNIVVNSAMNGSGTAGLALEYGQGAVAAGNTASYSIKAPVNLASTGSFSTKLGSDGATKDHTIVNSLGTEASSNDGTLQGIKDNLAGNYVLGANIDAGGTAGWNGGSGFTPIGQATPFNGSFDGLGHTIANLTIRRPASDYVGLFGRNTGRIANAGLTGAAIIGRSHAGALAGTSDGTLTNVSSSGTVTGIHFIGGLVGSHGARGSILQSRSSASVSFDMGNDDIPPPDDTDPVWCLGAETYCTGRIFSPAPLGGLAGYNAGSISHSYASGHVSGGGQDASIGLGGLVGRNEGTISNAYSTGNVSNGVQVGGLTGVNAGAVSNAYSTGAVSGAYEVGGLAGRNEGAISNSYSTGQATGDIQRYIGGMIGARTSGSAVAGSYWDTQTSGLSSSSAGTGITTAQTMLLATFAGWDISATGGSAGLWRIYEGSTRPLLRSLLTPLTVTADNLTKAYDGQTVAALANAQYSVPGAASSGHLLGTGAAYGGRKNAGVYMPALYSGQQGYDIAYAGAALTITKAPVTVAGVTAANKTYDGTTAATLSTGGATTVGVLTNETVSVASATGAFADKNAGVGKTVNVSAVILGGADAGNYVVTATAPVTADIAKASLTIGGTLAARDKTYDGTTAAGFDTTAASLVGLMPGDQVGLQNASGRFADANAGQARPVTLQATLLTGVDAGNYTVVLPPGPWVATITAASASVVDLGVVNLTIAGQRALDKFYDGTTVALIDSSNAKLAGLIAGDQVLLVTDKVEGRFADANAGTNKPVTVTGNALGGAGAGNYTLVQPTGLTASITPAPLAVTADSKAKVFGEADPQFTYKVSGFIGADTAAQILAGALGRQAGEAAGNSVSYTHLTLPTNREV